MAELRGLKADIYTLNRSLDGSTITFAMGKGDLERSKTTGAGMVTVSVACARRLPQQNMTSGCHVLV